ncbi:MAG: metallophosphoesterase [Planctomycetes bacterium]|nr:metallophosphoesterase [Planctomycetota bacterium]
MNRRQFLKIALGASASTSALSLGYARLEAGWLRVQRQTIAVPRLPAPFAGKTVALLADPHHGPFTSLQQIEAIVDTTNALRPDLVALAGDYVVESRGHVYIAPCLRELGRLRAPLGVFAVPGNHDHWDDIALTHQAIRDNGIIDVTNAGCWVEWDGVRLRVGGVDDLWTGKQHLSAALGDATADDACLLLCHNPDYVETLRDRRVGLVLSGHLHGGQIVVPGLGYHCLPSKYGTKYLHGLVRTPYTQVFVSRGLGTTGLPFRFRCRPEIDLLTLAAA